jgi:hypothetical protein
LIITGILIAVQISNWNEDRKAQAEFDMYVVQLREDVREAIEITEITIDTIRNSELNGLEILKSILTPWWPLRMRWNDSGYLFRPRTMSVCWVACCQEITLRLVATINWLNQHWKWKILQKT